MYHLRRRLSHGTLAKWICSLFCIFILLKLSGQPAVPTPVIFDSDMGPDYDDVGAIAMLHAFADSGKVKILATIASDKYEGVAAVMSVFNSYFGRPEIPIGVPKGYAVDERDNQHWTDSIIAAYPHWLKKNAEAEDAIHLYRRILSRAGDSSVVIITIGFLTNLKGLLESAPDSNSSLAGEALVKKKVKRLVSMAGWFPRGKEFNLFKDIPASRFVYSHWPVQVIFSGFEIGSVIKTGLPLIRNSSLLHSPVQDVFRIALPQSEDDTAGRSSWDETAVLVAVAGTGPWYSLKQGQIFVSADGSNSWKENKGNQFYLVPETTPAEMELLLNNLMQHQPRN